MITRLLFIQVSLFLSLTELQPNHKCEMPGNCLTHDTSRTDLPCEKKSDRWLRYQNATPAEREQMRARWREPMLDRIIRIYEVTALQEKMIRAEVEAIYAGHCTGMGFAFEEAERLDQALKDYAEAFTKRLREAERDDATEGEEAARRGLQDDLKYQNLLDRRQEIERLGQIDWNDALRRVEKLLAKEQVLKGRGSLTVALPHRCCKLWLDDAPTIESKDGGGAPAVHPWEAHVERFIERYRLSVGQIGAAKSILREVRQRAAQVDRSRFAELAAVHDLGDSAVFRARVEEFELRIDDLFDELNMRLDALLTTLQRQVLAPARKKNITPGGRP